MLCLSPPSNADPTVVQHMLQDARVRSGQIRGYCMTAEARWSRVVSGIIVRGPYHVEFIMNTCWEAPCTVGAGEGEGLVDERARDRGRRARSGYLVNRDEHPQAEYGCRARWQPCERAASCLLAWRSGWERRGRAAPKSKDQLGLGLVGKLEIADRSYLRVAGSTCPCHCRRRFSISCPVRALAGPRKYIFHANGPRSP